MADSVEIKMMLFVSRAAEQDWGQGGHVPPNKKVGRAVPLLKFAGQVSPD